MTADIIEEGQPLVPSRRVLVLVPTHTPSEDDPRDISDRARARLTTAITATRQLRSELGRGNVLFAVVGGWALHCRLPLALHHVLAATTRDQLLEIEEVDLIMGYGVNTGTDFRGLFQWTKENLTEINEALVVTSFGHAQRLLSETTMESYFQTINNLESGEPRPQSEDQAWSQRGKESPAHQFRFGRRGADVMRFGMADALEWERKMGRWAEDHPVEFAAYLARAWDLLRECEAANTIVRFRGAGAWRLSLNCD